MAQQKATCPRCDGKGVIPQYFYNRKGICFLCWGSGHIMVTVPADKDKDSYIKELKASEMERFKKHPPKVPMPDKKDQRNKDYFKGAKQGIPAAEPEGEAKPNAKTGGGAPKPDAKPAPKPQGSEAQKGEAVKRRNDKRKDELAALGVDTSRNGGDIWKATVDKFKVGPDIRSNFKVSEMAKAINEKDKKDGFRSAELITEAYIMAKLGDAIGKSEGLSASHKETLKKISPEKREDLKKSIRDNVDRYNKQTANMIAGVIASGNGESVDAVAASLKATLTAAKMLQDVDAVPYEGDEKAKDGTYSDEDEVKAVLRDSGINKIRSEARTMEDLKKVLDGLEKIKDNLAAKPYIKVFAEPYMKMKRQKEIKEFREKYNIDSNPNDPLVLAKAHEAASQIKDEIVREELLKIIKKMVEIYNRDAKGHDKKKEAAKFNAELKEKRAALAKNKGYNSTEIGKKIKAAVGDGLTDDKHARKVGKIAAAEFEKNITKFSKVSWEEFAASNKESRDASKAFASAKRELTKLVKQRDSVDNNAEYTRIVNRIREIIDSEAAMKQRILVAEEKVREQSVHIKAAKQKAYLQTLADIRETGHDMSFSYNTKLGNYDAATARHIDAQTRFFPESWVNIANTSNVYIERHEDRAGYSSEIGFKHRKKADGTDYVSFAPGGFKFSEKHPEHTVVHEIAHRMETTNPEIAKVLSMYYDRKTDGKEKQWLGGEYKEIEQYRKKSGGAWINNYMGKDYEGTAWEILTMSMESIIFDKHHSFTKRLDFDDTETYETIWGVIAGA